MSEIWSVRGWWSLDAILRDTPDGPATQLFAAPVGSHPPSDQRVAVDVTTPLAAALRLDDDYGFWPGEDRVSGLEWLEVRLDDSPTCHIWRRPTPVASPRPLLVADGPSRRPLGARALQGPSGFRLASLIGIGLDVLLGSFETANVSSGADEVARRSHRRHVVVAGGEALAALAGVERPGQAPERRAGELARVLGARSVRLLPHPSGRNADLNPIAARVDASATLLEAAVQTRGVPHLASPWELIGLEVVERSRMTARQDADPRVVLRHLVAAWACLGRAGVTWEGSGAHAGWREVTQAPRSWIRAWDRDDGSTRLLEVVPTSAGTTVARLSTLREAGVQAFACDSEEGALLLARSVAEQADRSAWARRDALLADGGRK